MGDECTHGHLTRQCEMCEKDNEIARLKRQIDAMRGVAQDDADAEIVLRQRASRAERERDELRDRLDDAEKRARTYAEHVHFLDRELDALKARRGGGSDGKLD